MLHSTFDVFFLSMILGAGLIGVGCLGYQFYREEVLPHRKMPMAKMNKRR